MTNTNQIVRNFPLSDVLKPKRTELPILPWLGSFYTKKEVDELIKEAVAEARRIDEESMRKHNRDATVISMILGFTTLAPFMDLDVNIIDDIANKTKVIVENDLVQAGLNKIPKLLK